MEQRYVRNLWNFMKSEIEIHTPNTKKENFVQVRKCCKNNTDAAVARRTGTARFVQTSVARCSLSKDFIFAFECCVLSEITITLR